MVFTFPGQTGNTGPQGPNGDVAQTGVTGPTGLTGVQPQYSEFNTIGLSASGNSLNELFLPENSELLDNLDNIDVVDLSQPRIPFDMCIFNGNDKNIQIKFAINSNYILLIGTNKTVVWKNCTFTGLFINPTNPISVNFKFEVGVMIFNNINFLFNLASRYLTNFLINVNVIHLENVSFVSANTTASSGYNLVEFTSAKSCTLKNCTINSAICQFNDIQSLSIENLNVKMVNWRRIAGENSAMIVLNNVRQAKLSNITTNEVNFIESSQESLIKVFGSDTKSIWIKDSIFRTVRNATQGSESVNGLTMDGSVSPELALVLDNCTFDGNFGTVLNVPVGNSLNVVNCNFFEYKSTCINTDIKQVKISRCKFRRVANVTNNTSLTFSNATRLVIEDVTFLGTILDLIGVQGNTSTVNENNACLQRINGIITVETDYMNLILTDANIFFLNVNTGIPTNNPQVASVQIRNCRIDLDAQLNKLLHAIVTDTIVGRLIQESVFETITKSVVASNGGSSPRFQFNYDSSTNLSKCVIHLENCKAVNANVAFQTNLMGTVADFTTRIMGNISYDCTTQLVTLGNFFPLFNFIEISSDNNTNRNAEFSRNVFKLGR